MIDPIFTAMLSAKSLSDLAKGELLKVSQKLMDRASKAHHNYEQERIDPGKPLEVFRNKCISKICDLQHEIILCVSDADFLKKVLPLLLEHIGNIYEAKTDRELTLIDMSLARIDNALSSYKEDKKRRKNIRMWAVLVSLLVLILLGLFLGLSSSYFQVDHRSTINILKIPVPVLIWSIIGSFSAILYRFANAGDKELNEPLRWLFARPLTGIIMGVISFLVLQVGLITLQGHEAGTMISNPEVIWLIAFLASFSDRFAESLLKTVVGKFGGDKEGELVSMEVRAKTTTIESSTNPVLEELDLDEQEADTADLMKKDLLIDKDGVNLKANNSTSSDLQAHTNSVKTSEIEVTQIKNENSTNK